MLVQAHCFANVLRRLLSPKNAAAFFMQEPCIHEVFNRAAWDEVRIELHKGSRPELLGPVGRVHELRDIVSPDLAETPRKLLVVGNDALTKLKDIHRFTLCDAWAPSSLPSTCHTYRTAQEAEAKGPFSLLALQPFQQGHILAWPRTTALMGTWIGKLYVDDTQYDVVSFG
jgi:hypothetical protein